MKEEEKFLKKFLMDLNLLASNILLLSNSHANISIVCRGAKTPTDKSNQFFTGHKIYIYIYIDFVKNMHSTEHSKTRVLLFSFLSISIS